MIAAPLRPKRGPHPQTITPIDNPSSFIETRRSSRPNPKHARRLASAFDDRNTLPLALDAEPVCRCGRTRRDSIGPSRDTRSNLGDRRDDVQIDAVGVRPAEVASQRRVCFF